MIDPEAPPRSDTKSRHSPLIPQRHQLEHNHILRENKDKRSGYKTNNNNTTTTTTTTRRQTLAERHVRAFSISSK